MKKRILSFALTIVLVFALIPVVKVLATDSWQDAYASYLRNYNSDGTYIMDFAIHDMDGDGTPELLLTMGPPPATAMVLRIVTYSNGSAKMMETTDPGLTKSISIPANGIGLQLHYSIRNFDCFEGVFWIAKIENGKYVEELIANYYNYDDDDNLYFYDSSGRKLTDEEVNSSISTTALEMHSNTESNIKEIIYKGATPMYYEAYYQVLKAATDKHGVTDRQYYQMGTYENGVCYAQLIDFDNNSTPELLYCYVPIDSYDCRYVIYTFDGKNTVKLVEDSMSYNGGVIYDFIDILTDMNKVKYVRPPLGHDTLELFELSTIINGKWQKVISFESDYYLDYKVNGKTVSEREYNSILSQYNVQSERIDSFSAAMVRDLLEFLNTNRDSPFSDVRSSDWYYDAVTYVKDNGIMKGTSDTTFEPNSILGRAMFAVVLYNMDNNPSVNYSGIFTDVPSGQWYSDAVIWANQNGIINGLGDGRFGSLDEISREQLATMLYRYARYKGCDMTGSTNLSRFSDSTSISSWTRDAISWCVARGYITGTSDNMLNPKGTANRAQCAVILMRFMLDTR